MTSLCTVYTTDPHSYVCRCGTTQQLLDVWADKHELRVATPAWVTVIAFGQAMCALQGN